MPSTIMMMIQKTRTLHLLQYDNDNEDDENAEVESYDSELNEIIPDDDLDDVELSEEDDDDDYEDETND